jgi:hypothetical protein
MFDDRHSEIDMLKTITVDVLDIHNVIINSNKTNEDCPKDIIVADMNIDSINIQITDALESALFMVYIYFLIKSCRIVLHILQELPIIGRGERFSMWNIRNKNSTKNTEDIEGEKLHHTLLYACD